MKTTATTSDPAADAAVDGAALREQMHAQIATVARHMLQGGTLASLLQPEPEALLRMYDKALAAYRDARYEEAQGIFGHLLLLDHRNKHYAMGLGASLQMRKAHREALGAYASASALDLTDPAPALHSAECHLALGEQGKARAAIAFALERARADERHAAFIPRLEAMQFFLDGGDTNTPDSKGPAA